MCRQRSLRPSSKLHLTTGMKFRGVGFPFTPSVEALIHGRLWALTDFSWTSASRRCWGESRLVVNSVDHDFGAASHLLSTAAAVPLGRRRLPLDSDFDGADVPNAKSAYLWLILGVGGRGCIVAGMEDVTLYTI